MSEKAYLELTDKNETRRLMLPKQNTLIGRAPDSDLVMPFPQISRHHARIYRQGEQYFIDDNSSVNGTFVNEKPIKTHLLKDGDQIRLGAVAVTFRNPAGARIQLSDEYIADANMTISVPITQSRISCRPRATKSSLDPRFQVYSASSV